jgi:hypothetical protein
MHETKKVVVTESKAIALRRCILHLIPILTSVAILTINLHGHYIGRDFPGTIKSETINIMLLQMAAKVHELVIVASLGLIVLHIVRHELLFGDGLPLGLVGSGLTFSNFEFFFRKEFYGSLKCLTHHGTKWRKIGFVAVLVLAGLTAVLAGPASAVLLVPKSQTWPGGGTPFFLNGSSNQFWPDDLSGDISELHQYCGNGNSTDLGICPGGGFYSLWEHWGRMRYHDFYEDDVPIFAKNLSGSRFYFPVHSPASQIPPMYALGNSRKDKNPRSYTFLVQAHAASATMLQRIAADWWKALTLEKGMVASLIDDRVIQAPVKNSLASVRCAQPQTIPASNKTVQFPMIKGRFDYAENSGFAVDTLNATAVDHLRFGWVHLPDKFGTASIGAVFESAWSAENNSRVVIGCTAQTGWLPATLFTDEYSFWSGWYPWNLDFGARTPRWVPVSEKDPLPATNGRIALGDTWLSLLTPPTPAAGPESKNWQPSTIESILENAGLADSVGPGNGTTLAGDLLKKDLGRRGKTSLLEGIICSVLVDGLSRTGSHRVFNTTGPVSGWSISTYKPLADFNKRILANQTALEIPAVPKSDLTTLSVSMQITGFAFTRSLAGFLAAAVLLTHIVMAFTHTIWVICNKRTSRSWNSVSELIALSQNSQPALTTLSNTGAGINCTTTFASVAKIRVRAQPGRPDLDHVELVFTDSADISSVGAHRRSSTVDLNSLRIDHRRTRSSLTWPHDPSKLHAPTEVEMGSRSSSTERLMPRVRLADEEKGGIVRVNQEYS